MIENVIFAGLDCLSNKTKQYACSLSFWGTMLVVSCAEAAYKGLPSSLHNHLLLKYNYITFLPDLFSGQNHSPEEDSGSGLFD